MSWCFELILFRAVFTVASVKVGRVFIRDNTAQQPQKEPETESRSQTWKTRRTRPIAKGPWVPTCCPGSWKTVGWKRIEREVKGWKGKTLTTTKEGDDNFHQAGGSEYWYLDKAGERQKTRPKPADEESSMSVIRLGDDTSEGLINPVFNKWSILE